MVGAVCILAAVLTPVTPQVYYGDGEKAEYPAEVEARKVFLKIPEYRQIRDKHLGPNDPEYWSLLSRANKKFYAAVEKVAEKHRYDAVVEKGDAPIENAPDITQKVIQALRRKPD